MKRLFSVISAIAIAVLSLFLLTSCLPDTPEPPYGVWMSEEPRIVLYLKPEYRMPMNMPIFVGYYTVGGIDTKIFATFGHGLQFSIFELAGMTERGA